MRTHYAPLSVGEYEVLFNENLHLKGSGVNDLQYFKAPVFHQHGSGVFTVLGNIVKGAIPFIRRLILPAVGEVIRDTSYDVSRGENFKQSLKRNTVKGIKTLGTKIARGGKVRKTRKKNKKKKRKSATTKRRKLKVRSRDSVFTKHQLF